MFKNCNMFDISHILNRYMKFKTVVVKLFFETIYYGN